MPGIDFMDIVIVGAGGQTATKPAGCHSTTPGPQYAISLLSWWTHQGSGDVDRVLGIRQARRGLTWSNAECLPQGPWARRRRPQWQHDETIAGRHQPERPCATPDIRIAKELEKKRAAARWCEQCCRGGGGAKRGWEVASHGRRDGPGCPRGEPRVGPWAYPAVVTRIPGQELGSG